MTQPWAIDLIGEGGTLRLEVEANGWTRCSLLADRRRIYLGAEFFDILASRLIAELHNAVPGTDGADFFGQPAHWVRSLAEAWCGIYVAPQGTARTVFFLAGREEPVRCIGRIELAPDQWITWYKQLDEVGSQHPVS